jgi:hypothetical protein
MIAWNNQTVRELETASIRAFVESCADHLTGRVLDYGCGRQPYRGIVEHMGATYVGHDRARYPANISGDDIGPDRPLDAEQAWDAILSTQTFQYVPWLELPELLFSFWTALRPGGKLVATGPTNWAEVQPEDLHRLTRAGVRALVESVGFEVERLESRAEIDLGGFRLSLGWGLVASA